MEKTPSFGERTHCSLSSSQPIICVCQSELTEFFSQSSPSLPSNSVLPNTMESQTRVSKRAPQEFRNWRVQGNPLTLRQPFANPSPTLCQPFLPTPLQPPLSVDPRHLFRDTGLRSLGKPREAIKTKKLKITSRGYS